MKDDQIAAVVTKIDTIVNFLKAKDFEDHEEETIEKVGLHQLDENLEYSTKCDFILENENNWK